MENILETKAYDIFKFGEWNRDIKKKNLSKIDKSVKAEGWKKHPIIVNENYEVIDGQHRLVYAKTHDLPVYYSVVNGLTPNDCVDMNNVRTPWTTEDYIKFYANQGNEHYLKLKALLNEYNFAPLTTMIAIIKDKNSGGDISRTIKLGNFKMTAKEQQDAITKYEYLKELAPYIKAVKGRQNCLFTAIAFCYNLECVDNERLKKQVKNLIAIITPPVNVEMALEEIERIYNRNIRRTDYIEIKAEYKKAVREKQQAQAQYLYELNQKRGFKRK